MIPTRGERNKNPGNLEREPGVHWQGMSVDQSGDHRFCVFDEPRDGIRALAKLLYTYYLLHNLDTVRGIVNRWAPPKENDTGAYVNDVAAHISVSPDDEINVGDPGVLQKMTKAIIIHENGRCIYDDAMIRSSVERGLL